MKIAVCIPVHEDTKAEFTVSLSRMLIFTAKTTVRHNETVATPDLEVMAHTGSLITLNRTYLVRRAIEWGAHFLLWADADHVFPTNSLVRLLGHNLPVVGVNYPRRGGQNFPTAVDLGGELIWTTSGLGGIQEVSHLGFGLCLMNMAVLNGLSEPLFETSHDTGEDAFFFRKLRQNGTRLYVDHALSWEVGHIGSRIITNADAGRYDARSSLPSARSQ